MKLKKGDIVTTRILCENGKTILLTPDTSLPRPYNLGIWVQDAGHGGLDFFVINSFIECIKRKVGFRMTWLPGTPPRR